MSFFKRLFGKQKEGESFARVIKPIDELKVKYFRNLELMVHYDVAIDCYCDIFDAWNEFPGKSDINYTQTHKIVKEILDTEYSEEICNKIKEGELTEDEIKNLVIKLENQYLIYNYQFEDTKAREDKLLEKFQNGDL